MRLLTIFILLSMGLPAPAQDPAMERWIDTKATYNDASGNAVVVHNSLPKGGGRVRDASGKEYGYVVIWTRLLNESNRPLELTVKFAAAPFTIFPSPDSHIRILLPPRTMSLDQVPLRDYGLTDIQSIVSAGLDRPGLLQRTVNAKEEYLFYTLILFNQARGSTRAAFVPQGQELSFKISISPDVDSALIPCGQLAFRN